MLVPAETPKIASKSAYPTVLSVPADRASPECVQVTFFRCDPGRGPMDWEYRVPSSTVRVRELSTELATDQICEGQNRVPFSQEDNCCYGKTLQGWRSFVSPG
jgi:hypothetical protein